VLDNVIFAKLIILYINITNKQKTHVCIKLLKEGKKEKGIIIPRNLSYKRGRKMVSINKQSYV